MAYNVIDLHCDLLLYLAGAPGRSPYDASARCSLPQLKSGGVSTQVFALFAETKRGSTLDGQKQWEHFPEIEGINALAAIENASILAEEDEPLTKAFERFHGFLQAGIPFAYLSLTWNDENRFGGGALSPGIGLKEDGKALLDYLAEYNLPVDVSHASDKLVEGIFSYIDAKKLPLTVIASHSNSRKIYDHPRNLPDELAREIFYRNGVIGLNFVTTMTGGEHYDDIFRHYAHFKALGGEGKLCFGADFFCPEDLPESSHKKHSSWFSPLMPDASCYPALLSHWLSHGYLSPAEAEALANKNAQRFLEASVSRVRVFQRQR